jgi:hypothetical protein
VCRLNEQPRSIAEIATVSKVAARRIKNCYRVLNRELDLPVPPASPRDYLPQIASAVDADRDTKRRARELLESADQTHIADGCNPRGAAAGALYLAGEQTGEDLTQGRSGSDSGRVDCDDQRTIPRPPDSVNLTCLFRAGDDVRRFCWNINYGDDARSDWAPPVCNW